MTNTTNEQAEFPYLVFIQFEESKKPYSFGAYEYYHVNDYVVVETVRGQEIGKVCVPTLDFDPKKVKGECKPVLRKATDEDLAIREENKRKAKEAMKICMECINNLKLDMHLIHSEYTLDCSKVIFTYVSDDRVDFRQLLKDLASRLHCRIELRQVGPRNKAKMVGGLGTCGMECCCSRFMSDFDTVSINMAKNQLLALNISKLSGQCGKLMCCLRFENDEYTELRKGLPKLNSHVTYEGNHYRLSSLNVLQRQAKIENRDEVRFVDFDELWPELSGGKPCANCQKKQSAEEVHEPSIEEVQERAVKAEREERKSRRERYDHADRVSEKKMSRSNKENKDKNRPQNRRRGERRHHE